MIPKDDAQDYWVNHAIREIADTYGHIVRVKPKSLLKFGASDLIGTSARTTVWNVGAVDETYMSSNQPLFISSSDASDAQDVKIEGHTLSGSDFTFNVQTVTLDGQTKIALPTNVARVSRAYNIGAIDMVGDVYVYEDDTVTAGVPQTTSKIHLKIAAGDNQTAKTATTFSSVDYYLMTGFYASVGEKASATVDFALEIMEFGQVFRPRYIHSAASTGGVVDHMFRPFLIIPRNSDVRVRAISSAANTAVDAGFSGILALIENDV